MASENKKELFRKYLENAGVIDTLTKVLVALYEEPDKPSQAIDFLKTQLGSPTPAEHEAVVAEKEALQAQVAELQQQVDELQAKLAGGAAEEGGAEAAA